MAGQPPAKSRNDPNYVASEPTRFGKWEGPVVVFNPRGVQVGYGTDGNAPTNQRD